MYTNYADPEEIISAEIDWDNAHLHSHQIEIKSIEQAISLGNILSFGCRNYKIIQITLERIW